MAWAASASSTAGNGVGEGVGIGVAVGERVGVVAGSTVGWLCWAPGWTVVEPDGPSAGVPGEMDGCGAGLKAQANVTSAHRATGIMIFMV
jgi:hypothetical protein